MSINLTMSACIRAIPKLEFIPSFGVKTLQGSGRYVYVLVYNCALHDFQVNILLARFTT